MQKIIEFGKELFKRFSDVDVPGMSSQLAYFFLLSLFPFLVFLTTLLGYLPIDIDSVLKFLDTYLPADVASMLESNLENLLTSQSGGLLSISIIGAIWSASKGVNALTLAFNKAYRVEEDRSFIVSKLISIGLTIALVVTIAIALLLPIFGKTIGEYIFSFVNLSDGFVQVWNTLRWVVSSVILFIVLYVLYILAPNKKVKLREAFWGAVFATISWQIVSLGFSFYVSTLGNFSATYGSLGTVIVLMLWFYLTGIVIITGGIINAVLVKRHREQVYHPEIEYQI
ncbi:MAG TPA: YihY/virulence factor BrkB family protein [Pseudogracilibacillus sp.]|nr:YihY/virulence factor BrkB family protein [Pseudogracilibacillus sp.]